VSVIQALAGTGKTYTAGVLRELYERAGFEVLGVAPTGRAARELADEARVAARTLDRLLIDWKRFQEQLPRRCVVILDEAGMAATRPTARLLEAAERMGAKVIAIGDPGQLASVQAGGWLGVVGRSLGIVRLTQVVRQRDVEERRALAALHAGEPGPYLNWAQRAGRIETNGIPRRCPNRRCRSGRARYKSSVRRRPFWSRGTTRRAICSTGTQRLCGTGSASSGSSVPGPLGFGFLRSIRPVSRDGHPPMV
jgi:hypothetical protein